MTSPVQEGDVLAGKYRVERVLGQGGMGVVVAATHLDLDQRVALKFLLPAALAHPEIVDRFAREARAVAKIRSQHVARVIDTGKMDDGTPFMVMEYLEGQDLSVLLEESGRLPLETAVDYMLQACEAMAEAHAAGIIHRDLKPANLFLAKQPDRRSIVKVLDFGISKAADPGSAQLTRTATMMGSPHYMSPEQLSSSKHVDVRSDIWALGVVLYELVSAQRPYDAETMPEIVARILGNTPPSLATLRPEMPEALVAVVMKCLETSPDRRFSTVAEFAAALSNFSSDRAHADAAVHRMSRVLGDSLRPKGADPTVIATAAPTRSDGAPAAGPARTAVVLDAPANGGATANTQMDAAVGAGPDPVRGGGRGKWAMLAGGGAVALIMAAAFVATRGHSTAQADVPAVTPNLPPSGAASAPPTTMGAADPSTVQSVITPLASVISTASSAPSSAAPSSSSPPRAAAHHGKAPTPTAPSPVATPPAVPATAKKNPLDMGIK